MENLIELSYTEMLDISGGSEKTYNKGYEHGAKFRKALDNVGVITLLVLIVSRGRIRV